MMLERERERKKRNARGDKANKRVPEVEDIRAGLGGDDSGGHFNLD